MADPADVKVHAWWPIGRWPKWAKWLGGLVLVWWVAGWTLPQTGRVVDEPTGKPVSGAYVIRYWNAFGMTLSGGRPSCIALRVDRTDESGNYFITPAWAGVAIRRDPLLQAMRNGIMVYAEGRSLSRMETGWPETIFVKAAPMSGEARLDELYRYFNLNGCGSDRELRRKVLGLYKAVSEEAASVAPEGSREQTDRIFRAQVRALEHGRNVDDADR